MGSKVFGYKLGNGAVDPILGMKLSYKDTPGGAEYEFENYLHTHEFAQRISDSIDTKLSWKQNVNGYFYFKQDDALTNLYKTSDVLFGAPKHYNTQPDDTVDLEIPVGYGNYRQEQEFIVHKINNPSKCNKNR